jgi:hypothetical protein
MNDSTKIMSLEPHQQRVIAEKEQLDEKIAALGMFLAGELFPTLDVAEQIRLTMQFGIMQDYSGVLGERIAAFNKVEVPFDQAVSDLAARTHKSKAEVLRDAVNLYYKSVNEWEENGRGIVFASHKEEKANPPHSSPTLHNES